MTGNYATDYIDVAARIVEFRTKYPEGSLQPADPAVPFRVEEIGGKQRIVVIAAAYRTPDDQRPGIGMAYEEVPGRSNFTRDSELQNAETSAWGRAIVAALAADTKKGIASAEEVRNRQADTTRSTKQHNRLVAQTLEDEKKAARGKKGQIPDDDPWQTPVTTDAEWMADWLGRLEKVTTIDALKTMWEEVVAQTKALQVSPDDLKALDDLKNAKKADLTGAAA